MPRPATPELARDGIAELWGIGDAASIFRFFGRWAAMIPLSALAAVLVVVSYHMSDWRSLRGLLRAPAADVTVLILTFGLTVFVDLTVAVQVGVVLAALLFMKRMADDTSVEGVREELREKTEDPAEISHIRRGARGRGLKAKTPGGGRGFYCPIDPITVGRLATVLAQKQNL